MSAAIETIGYKTLWTSSAGAAVAAYGDVLPDPLFPGEGSLVESAVESRRLEFARGRSCARRALNLLGIPAVPILRNERAPLWPPDMLGSITHCLGFACAAVAHSTGCRGLGIDAEFLQPIEDRVAEQILTPCERARLDKLDSSVPWACVAFSIKEAIFKAWYPRTRTWLGFHDADVVIDPVGTFTAYLPCASTTPGAGDLAVIPGSFVLDNARVLAVVELLTC